ncbi:ABC transporter substrate-binding protein [Rhodospirillum rubrum]|uniref:Twin-arginine translocation pathway signal n=1 Tax=Rhodospirillum rubrum (strain ATCC 11170 / ATH 1.1.1 / DSM 467 / LMG 4362 / NCIMB 8255 / S1) TaxID=269796 RepID=Q2RST1_RHORT|nr:ABC transporter substrate-binding protein [Rhodospirillum rubrum]ABC22814.1 Twin-arginine translocation pathway signal [Rhodospirillum rubrum ATCC 11170]AEO48536.1 twin-arginine translocation pathway signal [Rhodospirillum rubrum F11]MBK5954412.1 peptide ABC transporter substrate-binding protein [Rhodospirillum rubrum]QXG78804.1 ABC transporter substrate-binding protein [Rhodospirillum rubrum]HAP98557.1 ABC transporter substrate-binding protein [Rhodospirillum rubrum]
MSLSRRSFLASTALLAGAAALPRFSWAQGAPAPVAGGVLTAHLSSEQRILNPALRASTGVYVITSKIIESLVDLGPDGAPTPVLATRWEAAADGKSVTFTLREGVKWHDGKPFTSADVQYSAMELWKKHLNYGTQLQRYLEAVDTPDATTAIFRYSRTMPLPLLLRALADLGYVVPRHLFEGTNVLENPANTAPIGTGPFKFVEYQRGQYIVAERNPEYWRKGEPYLDRVVWRFITDKSAASAALETGQVQISAYTQLALSDIERLAKDSRFEVSSRGNEANSFNNTVEFNHRRKELADVRVRRAIAHAVDVDFFVENFLYGRGKRATGFIPSISQAFYPGGAFPYPFDTKKAEALLDEAGYPRQKGGERFSLRLLPILNGEDVPQFATFLQQSLAEVGIKVEIVQLDVAGALSAIYKDWNFDLATGWHQYRGDPAVSTTVWFRSGSPKGAPWTNQFGWESAEVDTLIDDAAAEIDPVKRKALYAQLVDVINEELPVWFATERQFVSVTNKVVQNHHNIPRWPSSDWHDTWIAK